MHCHPLGTEAFYILNGSVSKHTASGYLLPTKLREKSQSEKSFKSEHLDLYALLTSKQSDVKSQDGAIQFIVHS